MKLKITEQGWENFSGNLGITVFENGVSLYDVPQTEINVISGNIRVVNFENDENVGVLELNADLQNKPCSSHNLQTWEEILNEQASPSAKPVKAVQTAADKYTQEELEAIADKSGIAGLREVCDKIGVKGTSIVGLINGVIAMQNPPQNAAMLDSGQPEVTESEE